LLPEQPSGSDHSRAVGRACRASRRARIGEDLDPVAAAVDPLPGEVHAPQGADLGRFLEPLPVSAGDVLGIVDLVAGPERAEWVVAQVGDGTGHRSPRHSRPRRWAVAWRRGRGSPAPCLCGSAGQLISAVGACARLPPEKPCVRTPNIMPTSFDVVAPARAQERQDGPSRDQARRTETR